MKKIVKLAVVAGILAAAQLALVPAASASTAPAAITCSGPPEQAHFVDVICNGGTGRFRAVVTCRNSYDGTRYTVTGPWRAIGGTEYSRGNCGADGTVTSAYGQIG